MYLSTTTSFVPSVETPNLVKNNAFLKETHLKKNKPKEKDNKLLTRYTSKKKKIPSSDLRVFQTSLFFHVERDTEGH